MYLCSEVCEKLHIYRAFFRHLLHLNIYDMGKADRKITRIVTDEGLLLYRRVTEVIMPNGKMRYPVDYFDATPGVVKVSKAERHKLSIPVYDKII